MGDKTIKDDEDGVGVRVDEETEGEEDKSEPAEEDGRAEVNEEIIESKMDEF